MVNEQHKKLSPFCLYHLIHQQHPSVVRFPPNAKHRWPIFMLMFGAGAVCTGIKQLYSEGNFTYAPYKVSIPIVCSHGSAPKYGSGGMCVRGFVACRSHKSFVPIALDFCCQWDRFALPSSLSLKKTRRKRDKGRRSSPLSGPIMANEEVIPNDSSSTVAALHRTLGDGRDGRWRHSHLRVPNCASLAYLYF